MCWATAAVIPPPHNPPLPRPPLTSTTGPCWSEHQCTMLTHTHTRPRTHIHMECTQHNAEHTFSCTLCLFTSKILFTSFALFHVAPPLPSLLCFSLCQLKVCCVCASLPSSPDYYSRAPFPTPGSCLHTVTLSWKLGLCESSTIKFHWLCTCFGKDLKPFFGRVREMRGGWWWRGLIQRTWRYIHRLAVSPPPRRVFLVGLFVIGCNFCC